MIFRILSGLSWFDIVNGSFELLGTLFICMSIRRLYLDKQVKGVSLYQFTFYSLWGWWNIIFYPTIGQWFSFWAGLSVLSANMAWLSLMLYYRRKA